MDTKTFLEHMAVHMTELQEEGHLQMGIMHDDDTPVIVMSGWTGVYMMNTLMAIESGCYNKYALALHNAEGHDKHGQMTYHIIPGPNPVLFDGDAYIDNAHMVEMIDDLRLGTDLQYPSTQYNTPFRIPSPLDELNDAFEEQFGEFVFDDEYSNCSECSKVIRTSPDSYGWMPDYVETEWGDLIHVDCIDVDYVLESHKNKQKALPYKIQDKAIKAGTIVEISDITYENGFHPGQNDDPKPIIKAMKLAGIDCWFDVTKGQFDLNFCVLVRPEDKAKAREILSHLDVYQGYDTATEMSNALKGIHSDYVHVETYTISQQDLLDGKLPG